jgi:hypothetical protein
MAAVATELRDHLLSYFRSNRRRRRRVEIKGLYGCFHGSYICLKGQYCS